MYSIYVLNFLYITILINGLYGLYNDTELIINEWTTSYMNDANLQKSKAIYTPISSKTPGVWILGGKLNDGTITDSITFLDYSTDDAITYNDFTSNSKKANTLPIPIYCEHQCSTTVNYEDIVIVSPYIQNGSVINKLWIIKSIFDSTAFSIQTLSS